MRVVIDTNILVSALMSSENACRAILRQAFSGQIQPLVGNALFCEYEDVLSRYNILDRIPLSKPRVDGFLDDFLSVSTWIEIHYLWRPNLRDEADNHVVELALSGGAKFVITQNMKDFKYMDLDFDNFSMIHPYDFLDEGRKRQWQQ